MKTLWRNIQHLPSTIFGTVLLASVALQNPRVQALVSILPPKAAQAIGAAGTITAGVVAIAAVSGAQRAS